ncbi:dihydrofolate reductase family protein [Streptomonospora nanhaiensis]|uniref:dihydrofolate reductase family protein n=1 Tax=Streptomonospora nanhaiensis TaxID=1323731 RepID=UPI001C3913DF|nr:dihydrofolate reductase family protein [Streptomonospora nanhaiensis]MBV2365771.1 dihydrofolate reductase family protein [Streptomonospora nanhaiensis]
MRSVTYSMVVSLDGYIVGPDGSFDWTAPDKEVFDLATDEVRGAGVHLLGRRLYETMLYWETADQHPSLDFSTREFAAIWKALPKVVFSTTLSAVRGNARLASGGLAEEIERLRAEPGEGDIAIGGATLAAEAAELGSGAFGPGAGATRFSLPFAASHRTFSACFRRTRPAPHQEAAAGAPERPASIPSRRASRP